ncbi:MAG: hypothetical protein P4L55_17815 [Syntrophobacteraceae bacterium]|nr:hypothetical protein [Syntrophobacteraceae bacterium]
MPEDRKSRVGLGGACPWDGPPVALLWTHSLVWGLLCIDALSSLGIPFRLLSASEVCQDRLDDFRILLVPGGWAAHKAHALGEKGRAKIAGFIDQGGSYIGFCGGAGLVLSSPPALYLVPIRRMVLSERLPSASGRVYVSGTPTHSAFKDIPEKIPVSIWWPSQFLVPPDSEVSRLASYTRMQADDFQVADIRVCDADGAVGWGELERAYGINLDPARLEGQPAIIEARRGKGRLVLSYAHLETPGDTWGNRLFFNLLKYLDRSNSDGVARGDTGGGTLRPFPGRGQGGLLLTDMLAGVPGHGANGGTPLSGTGKARQAVSDLIAFGEANLLWNWRKPWLLNWRRGIRGLEYGSLFVCLGCMAALEKRSGRVESTEELEQMTLEFCGLARRLLFEEKIASGLGAVSKIGKVNDKVDSLRGALFGGNMNHGGLCAALFDLIDRMLLDALRESE